MCSLLFFLFFFFLYSVKGAEEEYVNTKRSTFRSFSRDWMLSQALFALFILNSFENPLSLVDELSQTHHHWWHRSAFSLSLAFSSLSHFLLTHCRFLNPMRCAHTHRNENGGRDLFYLRTTVLSKCYCLYKIRLIICPLFTLVLHQFDIAHVVHCIWMLLCLIYESFAYMQKHCSTKKKNIY